MVHLLKMINQSKLMVSQSKSGFLISVKFNNMKTQGEYLILISSNSFCSLLFFLPLSCHVHILCTCVFIYIDDFLRHFYYAVERFSLGVRNPTAFLAGALVSVSSCTDNIIISQNSLSCLNQHSSLILKKTFEFLILLYYFFKFHFVFLNYSSKFSCYYLCYGWFWLCSRPRHYIYISFMLYFCLFYLYYHI